VLSTDYVYHLLISVCLDPLGMKDGSIQDSQITSSSYYSARLGPQNGRLDGVSPGAWAVAYGHKNVNQWIQVDFGALRLVSEIVTQGMATLDQWVKRYKVMYSNDGITWQYVKDENQVDDMVRIQDICKELLPILSMIAMTNASSPKRLTIDCISLYFISWVKKMTYVHLCKNVIDVYMNKRSR
jgi:hypothetical protein